ncbi:MAG: hypothetical protein AVDCRST_MAG05-3865, partial [uncultured Rubrobacteraceae bacterium]
EEERCAGIPARVTYPYHVDSRPRDGRLDLVEPARGRRRPRRCGRPLLGYTADGHDARPGRCAGDDLGLRGLPVPLLRPVQPRGPSPAGEGPRRDRRGQGGLQALDLPRRGLPRGRHGGAGRRRAGSLLGVPLAAVREPGRREQRLRHR